MISLFPYSAPDFCHSCGTAYPWTAARPHTATELSDKLDPDEYDTSHLHSSEQTRIRDGDLSRDELAKLMRGENPWAKATPSSAPKDEPLEDEDLEDSDADTIEPVKLTIEAEDSLNLGDSVRRHERPPRAIEIRTNAEVTEGNPGQYQLFIGGARLVDASVSEEEVGEAQFSIWTTTIEATNKLLEYSLLQIWEIGVGQLKLHYTIDWQETLSQIWIPESEKTQTYSLYFMLNKIRRWRRSYSFDEYWPLLVRYIRESEPPNIDVDEGELAGVLGIDVFMVKFTSLSSELPIAVELERCTNQLRSIHEKVESELESRFRNATVEVSFDFPEEVRVPCEQYLLYFVQFLKDLGVEATADLRHVAGEVLFAITPKDKETALDNIREALQTYLQLASSPLDNGAMVEYEIAAQRLAANVDHLKGQVRLVNAELRLADATIQQQQITIHSLLSSEAVLKSLNAVDTKPASDEPERLLGGTLALTTFDKYGVRVSLGEVFRKLRRLFSGQAPEDSE